MVTRAMSQSKKSPATSIKTSNSSVKISESTKNIKEAPDLSTSTQERDTGTESIKSSGISRANRDRRGSSWGFSWPNSSSNTSKSQDHDQLSRLSFEAGSKNSSSAIANDDNETTAIEPDDSKPKKQVDSWINWGRKQSTDSLSKLARPEPSNELLSRPKAIITHDEQGKSIEVKASRSLSWSIWNNTSNAEMENNFKEDLVLFEPSNPKENLVNSKNASKKPVSTNPNIIVPNLEEVLPYESFFSKISNIVSYSTPRHLQRTRPKPFKRVLIVGVHGFFPAKMLRPLIGEPTGTSIKFANEAEIAILKWAKDHNLDISIQKIALEKEGKINDRVDYFYNVMEKWKDEIQKSDFVFFACHSQGTPVTISLLARLISTGVIENDRFDKNLGILAMAGVNNGPYYGADQTLLVKAYSKFESDSMTELFEFQNFDSDQSKNYLESIRVVVGSNTKICFVGSIDDQLVPLYSAIASHIEHPNIYRACYIDGGTNTPAFVSRVVGISLWLKNLGLSDHGVIKEISDSLAGPLTGGGHSKIYNEPNVYELAINFFLTTNDLNVSNPQPVHFNRFLLNTNPYHLPWCMRGLVFEGSKNIPNGRRQVEKVLTEFDDWKPESKVLKDLKYRLSAIKLKL